MADYLRNCWYVACGADEIAQGPLGRILLDTPIVLYRDSKGTATALQDRCPHRFVPLSLGTVVGNNLKCLYHGLEFGPDGGCAFNPHDRTTSGRVRVETYPVCERYGYVWIWLGQAEMADVALLPDLPFLDDEEHFRAVTGYLPVDANYVLITDNLLDLSHVEFLHPLFARKEGVSSHRTEFRQEGNSVIANRWKPDTSLNDFARLFWDLPGDRGDGRANMRWTAPSSLYFDLGTCAVGGNPADGICNPAAHLLTPETAYRTHYFWAQGRNRRLNDPALDEQLHAIVSDVFQNEDLLVIEAQQKAMGAETELFALKPLLMKSDTPTVMARRTLQRLIEEESASASAPMPGSMESKA